MAKSFRAAKDVKVRFVKVRLVKDATVLKVSRL